MTGQSHPDYTHDWNLYPLPDTRQARGSSIRHRDRGARRYFTIERFADSGCRISDLPIASQMCYNVTLKPTSAEWPKRVFNLTPEYHVLHLLMANQGTRRPCSFSDRPGKQKLRRSRTLCSCFLHVKFRQIMFSSYRGEVANVSAHQRLGRQSLFSNHPPPPPKKKTKQNKGPKGPHVHLSSMCHLYWQIG